MVVVLGCTESGTVRLDSQIAEAPGATSQVTSRLELADGMLVIDRAQIAVSEIEIEGGEEEHEEREADLGPAVIDLSLDGTPTEVTATAVEAGSYDTIGFELTTRTFADGEASVIVWGSYDGAPFVYRTTWVAEVEFRLDPAVVVPADGEATIGVTFDVAAWMLDAEGSPIDPTQSSNQDVIRRRIIDSMTAEAIEVELEGEDDD
jgi:hypothetical protein